VSYTVNFSTAAREDIKRLIRFLSAQDVQAAKSARRAIENSIKLLQEFPFTCRRSTSENPFMRELVISFGSTGYVALFEIGSNATITIVAVRHQREEDFH
jgi:plasmid stabilization system protein ParE